MVISHRTLTIVNQALSKSEQTWRTLFSRCIEQSPFTSYEWYRSLCTHVLHDDPNILTFWNNDQPVGVFAATIISNTLSTIQDERVTDIADIIIEPGFEIPVIEALAEFINTHNLGIDLFPLETNSTIVEHLPVFIDDITVSDGEVCPYLILSGTWNDYLAHLAGKHRHELRRKMKRGVEIELFPASADDIKIFFNLMERSGVEKKRFLTENIRLFIKNLTTSLAQKNWLHLRIACLESTPVGALLCFTRNSRIYLFNSGYDPHYMNLSPGIISIARDIQWAIDHGYTHYDFLRGNESYKLRFAPLLRPMKRLNR